MQVRQWETTVKKYSMQYLNYHCFKAYVILVFRLCAVMQERNSAECYFTLTPNFPVSFLPVGFCLWAKILSSIHLLMAFGCQEKENIANWYEELYQGRCYSRLDCSCTFLLKSLLQFSLEKRRLRYDFITVYNFFKGVSRWEAADLPSLVISDKTRVNGMKLLQGKLRLNIWKRFFADSHWSFKHFFML